jgi:hypothetical protein
MRTSFVLGTSSMLFWQNEAVDLLSLDPCKLLCHMQHTIHQCKLVSTTTTFCKNLYWTNGNKSETVIDRLQEDEYLSIGYEEAASILKVGKSGCDKLCETHPECVDIGSECKVNGVCLNLFWNRGQPNRAEMSSCYQLSPDGCDDGTPVLCGSEKSVSWNHAEGGTVTNDNTAFDTEEAKENTHDTPANASSSGAIDKFQKFTSILLVIPFVTHW